MSFIQLESLDPQDKHAFRNYRRTFAPLAILAGTTILGLILLSGALKLQGISIAPPMTTDIAIRPDFPVSTFIYKRGAFSWFIGVALAVGGGGLAFTAVGLSCIVVSGATLVAGCVVAAVGAAAVVGSILQQANTNRQLRLAQQAMIYMDYADKSAKRTIDPVPMDDHQAIINKVFGSNSNYQFAGHITDADKNHGKLLAKNGGEPVPVFSFTTPQGIPLHHVMIEDKATGRKFHRFGFNNGSKNSKRQSTTDEGSTEEYFSSEGIDILDCTAGDTNGLTDNDTDNDNMQSELQCAAPNLENGNEIAIQVYDATTQETIAGIRVAPYDNSGDSVLIDDSDYSSCPASLTDGDTCPQESDSD